MKIAYTVAKNVLMRKQADNEFLETAHIHVHVPEVKFKIILKNEFDFLRNRVQCPRTDHLPDAQL